MFRERLDFSYEEILNIIRKRLHFVCSYTELAEEFKTTPCIIRALVLSHLDIYFKYSAEKGVHLGNKKESYYKNEKEYELPNYTYSKLSKDEREMYKKLGPNERWLKLYSFEKEETSNKKN
jgi:hypothetical protein